MAGTGDLWRIWIDTGGTFTDCVARTPDGEVRRAKVLSSSALRGVVRQVAAKAGVGPLLTVEPAWALPAGFFAGCTFHVLGGRDDGAGEGGVAIRGWDAAQGRLTLAAPLSVAAGDRFEIRSPEEAPVLAARLVTGTPHGRPLPPVALRLATTRGTNALLERRGAAVALFVSRGFADLLEIGTQQRPDLFALQVEKPRPLYAAVVEVDERLDAAGEVLRAPDLDSVEAAVRNLRDGETVDTAAVAFLHSYLRPDHERAVAELLRSAGFTYVAESAELAPLIKILPRAETAVVEAYLAPILGDYLDAVAAALPPPADDDTTAAGAPSSLHVMTSAGGLVRRGDYRAKDSLLSGPAGGVAGAARAGRRSGFDRLVGFDMGGTSTDVARYDGDFEYVFEHRVGDAHLVAPALAIETVAAGGGSICAWRDGRLRVGPQSAGARPGPACYGGGGPLTLTDVNLLLGLLDPERFGIPMDPAAAEAVFADMVGRRAAQVGDAAPGREELLAGFRAIADERMADAIRAISVRRGYDPADYALVAFGGAGGQHACAVADRLGIATVLVPPDAGLLSAVGLGAAVVERFAQRQVLRPLDDLGAELPRLLAELAQEARAAVRAEAGAEVEVRRRILHLRFVGQDATESVETDAAAEPAAVRATFTDAYRRRYGYLPRASTLEVESVRVVASTERPEEAVAGGTPPRREPSPAALRRAHLGGVWRDVPVHLRADLALGDAFAGPALVYEAHGATVVEPFWNARVDAAGCLVLRTAAPS